MNQQYKLPIGIQTFSHIRLGGYYVDKTALALDLLNSGKHHLLSRPRRFGKSLFLDTLKELFVGNSALFKGLNAEHHWDWSTKYTVLRFSFGSHYYTNTQALDESLNVQLTHQETELGFKPQFKDACKRFADLIVRANKQSGQPVIILIDEYDKPILDAIDLPDIAKENRHYLSRFYGTIKDHDSHIKFSFLTGVCNFSKSRLFQNFNNLQDITLDPNFATICGFTDDDIDTVFAAELEGMDRDNIREWYSGYNWLGESVYNPIDILHLCRNRSFKNYWYETGAPDFLVNLIIERKISTPRLNKLTGEKELLSSLEIDHIMVETLMFQSGYLTIKNVNSLEGNHVYQLDYPNLEVCQGLNSSLLKHLVYDGGTQVRQRIQLYKLLQNNDLDGLQQLFQSFYTGIPNHWYTNSDIQNYDGFYVSVFYSYFASLGLDITVEDCTDLRRIDMTLKFNSQVYIFGFKVVELAPEGNALQQTKDKAYADKYRSLNQPIHLIGVEFSKESRNVEGFDVEQA